MPIQSNLQCEMQVPRHWHAKLNDQQEFESGMGPTASDFLPKDRVFFPRRTLLCEKILASEDYPIHHPNSVSHAGASEKEYRISDRPERERRLIREPCAANLS